MSPRHALTALLVLFAVIVPVLLPASTASANVPMAVQARPGDQLPQIARAHHVSVAELLKANPQIATPTSVKPGQWVYLPASASLPGQPVFAVSAPSETELKYVLAELKDDTVYRIMGRQFHLASWMGQPVLVFATGGGMDNPAIGVTIAAEHFNVQKFCYQGIGGAGHGVDIGDVLVATAVVPGLGHGNEAPLQTPSGDVVIGQFWSYQYGEPVITDGGTVGQLALVPAADFLTQVKSSVQKVLLPTVNAEVAAYESAFFGRQIEPYSSEVHLGWTSTGPFFTSDLGLTQVEERSKILAGIQKIPAPEFIAVDMEDYEAVHAAVEAGIADWCVVRSAVDLAREKLPTTAATAGVPWAKANDPAQPWQWIYENQGSLGYFEDYDYFYRLPYLLMRQIVADARVGQVMEGAGAAVR